MKPLYVSHRNDTRGGNVAPIKPHLALKTGNFDGDPNSLLLIPPGATLFIIKDPRRADTVLSCVLEKVEFEDNHFKGLVLRAYSKALNTTRRLYLTAAWTGEHKSPLDEANKHVEENMDTLGKGPAK